MEILYCNIAFIYNLCISMSNTINTISSYIYIKRWKSNKTTKTLSAKYAANQFLRVISIFTLSDATWKSSPPWSTKPHVSQPQKGLENQKSFNINNLKSKNNHSKKSHVHYAATCKPSSNSTPISTSVPENSQTVSFAAIPIPLIYCKNMSPFARPISTDITQTKSKKTN